jgi:type IV fimbrial biogenesis protein FimT
MKNLSGFSLIELLTLISIVAILAAIALPSFTTSMKGNRDISQINTLLDGLSLARSHAITYGQPVVICPGNTNACTDGNWADGWIVYYSTLPPGATTTTIREFPKLSGNNTLTGAPNAITFLPTGMTPLTANVTFTLCDGRGPNFGRSIELNITGRAEVASQIGHKVDGTALASC